MERTPIARGVALALGTACLTTAVFTQASSHREAPFITEEPKVDNTDLYIFRSYEGVAADGTGGRSGFVTILSNFQPFQDPWGGPNYYSMDENAVYDIHIDNDGDAIADMTFRFRFDNEFRRLAVDGNPADTEEVTNAIPIINNGPVTEPADENLNRVEGYTVEMLREGVNGTGDLLTDSVTGDSALLKPVDYIGQKSLPSYEDYARQHIHDVVIPGCDVQGARVFVGQRREGFYINVGETFDLLNFNNGQPPATFAGFARDAAQNNLDVKNVTTLALEVPIECLVADDPVIGAWTSASLPQVRVLDPTPDLDTPTVQGGPYTQVSRLANPLVNEVVIGLPDKNLFNATAPVNDVENFGEYVLYPTLPVLASTLFGIPIPPTPRDDLAQVFITGVPNLNQPANVNPDTLAGGGELLRLNTSIPPDPTPALGNLGVLDCELAGYPNGRRPVDDVVDISLTAVEGALLPDGGPLQLQFCDTSGETPQVVNAGRVITDGTIGSAGFFINQFPYLATPLPGSPNEADGQAEDSQVEGEPL
jgi:hypothetical protein